ncbi:unnamed protein product [Calicophoron daubneyi]|uniref:F-ATPase delta subunit n=1 Tax=Calicophoron daubneyi TaxID=300641 RepID=A0AAV2T798_CALDB
MMVSRLSLAHGLKVLARNASLRILAQRCRMLSTSFTLRADLKLTFASPARVFYDGKVVRQVDVPTLTGRFGVLAEHVPTIGCLKPGVVNVIEEDGSTKSYFVSSGIVTVNGDSTMQLLAEEAVTLDQLDPQSIRDGLTKAQSDLSSAQTELAKAEAQILTETYEELSRAVETRH